MDSWVIKWDTTGHWGRLGEPLRPTCLAARTRRSGMIDMTMAWLMGMTARRVTATIATIILATMALITRKVRMEEVHMDQARLLLRQTQHMDAISITGTIEAEAVDFQTRIVIRSNYGRCV